MHRIYEAIKFAERKHKGQVRKATGLPYITHPVAVGFLLTKYKKSKNLEDLIIACILHDVLEDTNTTYAEILKRFGPLVASLVLELTNDAAEIKRVGKLDYQAAKLKGISSYALICKLVDRLHNMLDHPTKKMVADTMELMTRLKKTRKLSKTHKRIVADIEVECIRRQAAIA